MERSKFSVSRCHFLGFKLSVIQTEPFGKVEHIRHFAHNFYSAVLPDNYSGITNLALHEAGHAVNDKRRQWGEAEGIFGFAIVEPPGIARKIISPRWGAFYLSLGERTTAELLKVLDGPEYPSSYDVKRRKKIAKYPSNKSWSEYNKDIPKAHGPKDVIKNFFFLS